MVRNLRDRWLRIINRKLYLEQSKPITNRCKVTVSPHIQRTSKKQNHLRIDLNHVLPIMSSVNRKQNTKVTPWNNSWSLVERPKSKIKCNHNSKTTTKGSILSLDRFSIIIIRILVMKPSPKISSPELVEINHTGLRICTWAAQLPAEI